MKPIIAQILDNSNNLYLKFNEEDLKVSICNKDKQDITVLNYSNYEKIKVDNHNLIKEIILICTFSPGMDKQLHFYRLFRINVYKNNNHTAELLNGYDLINAQEYYIVKCLKELGYFKG